MFNTENLLLDYKRDNIIEILNKGFGEVVGSFSNYNINIAQLSDNLFERIYLKQINNLNNFSVIGAVFYMLNVTYNYYKAKKNEIMMNFISLSILEKHLMLLEGQFDNVFEPPSKIDLAIIDLTIEMIE